MKVSIHPSIHSERRTDSYVICTDAPVNNGTRFDCFGNTRRDTIFNVSITIPLPVFFLLLLNLENGEKKTERRKILSNSQNPSQHIVLELFKALSYWIYINGDLSSPRRIVFFVYILVVFCCCNVLRIV